MTYPIIRKKIPEKIYREIHSSLPLICVDLVVADGKKFFLVKRKNKPEKGRWWFLGGRILKNEKLKEAAKRLLRTETGLNGEIEKLMGFYEYFASPGYFAGINTHTIQFVFKTRASRKAKVSLDKQSSEGRWFSKIDDSWHPYVKRFLKEAGF